MLERLKYLREKMDELLQTSNGLTTLGHYKKSCVPEEDRGKQVYEKYDHLINYYEHMSEDELSVALRSKEPGNRYPPLT